jgi:hypothetical protein
MQKIIDIISKIQPLNKVLVLCILLLVLFLPGLIDFTKAVFDPFVFYDDERQYLPPFDKFLPNSTPSDYAKDYYINAISPYGFKTVMAFIYTHSDVRFWRGVILLLNLILTTLFIGLVAMEIGGLIISFSAVALFLSTPFFTSFAMGGITPRMFSFLVIILATYFILRKKIYPLAITTFISSLIYPPMAIMTGIMMAIWLLLTPSSNILAISNWNLKKKILVLGLTALMCIIAIAPQALNVSSYGTRLAEKNLVEYPEIGISGRYGSLDSMPYQFIINDTIGTFKKLLPFYPSYTSILLVIFGIVILLVFSAKKINSNNPKSASITILFIGGLISYLLAFALKPYLFIPSRCIAYTIPLFLIIIIPLSIEKIGKQLFGKESLLIKLFIIISISTYAISGYKSITSSFIQLNENEKKCLKFIETLPPTSCIAGWPNGIINNVPLFAHRNALLTFETHQVFMENYLKTMRIRTYALIGVYFATSKSPLLELRDKFGVSHLIIETKYASNLNELYYFSPFNIKISEKLKNTNKSELILNSNELRNAIVYSDSTFRIINLSNL